MELNGIFEDGEYGTRNGAMPRIWHNEFMKKRREAIEGHAEGQHVFNLFAGTGAGKTFAAGMVAQEDLNLGRVRRIVVCVPTVAIAENVQEKFREDFGIHLALFNRRRHPNGVTSESQGYVITYAAVSKQPQMHRRIASYEPTLVILDEVHHLGDQGESWGDAAKLAFANTPFVFAMTGSPLRPKGVGQIPFAVYEPTDNVNVLRYKADYPYSLGKAIIDGYCREPDFRFSNDVVVDVRPAGSTRSFTINPGDKLSESLAQIQLSASVQFGSVARRKLLESALPEIKKAGRKVIIFLGGDTAGSETMNTPTADATIHLPSELAEMGIARAEYTTITMADKKPHQRVKEFLASDTTWILITVNMASEGVDLPQVSAEIFLTTWVSPLSFIQRVGRALRYSGKGDFPDAWIYLFHHPAYHDAALAIKEEMKAEAALKAKAQREQNGTDGAPRQRTEAVARSGGNITHAVWNGVTYLAPVYNDALRYIQSHGLSKAFLTDVIERYGKERKYDNGDL